MQLKTLQAPTIQLKKCGSKMHPHLRFNILKKQCQETALYVKTWVKAQSLQLSTPVLDGYENLEKIPKKNRQPPEERLPAP